MEPRLKLGSNSDSIVYTTPVHCTHFMQLGEQVLHLTVSVLFSHFSYLPISPPLLSHMSYLLYWTISSHWEVTLMMSFPVP